MHYSMSVFSLSLETPGAKSPPFTAARGRRRASVAEMRTLVSK